jgi:lysophospholipid acyltransferase (LPLAT)-like uncharacterized protein
MAAIGLYDIKTKAKHIIRSIFYTGLFQSFLCFLISNYIRLVFITGRKSFSSNKLVDSLIKEGKPFIAVSWHNRVAISSYIFHKARKSNKNYKFGVLVSNHGDGAIIGLVMKSLGNKVISGSTRKNNDSKKGITIGNFRDIFRSLKGENGMCITPDGPRGPRFKVGGHVSAIAKIAQVPVVPISCSSSRRKVLNSWDRFMIPMLFSKISFCIGDPIYVSRNSTDKELVTINDKIKDGINYICVKSDDMVGVTNKLD